MYFKVQGFFICHMIYLFWVCVLCVCVWGGGEAWISWTTVYDKYKILQNQPWLISLR